MRRRGPGRQRPARAGRETRLRDPAANVARPWPRSRRSPATHEVVITHGNGPQVGLLALESAADHALTHPYPLDVLGAQTQGMIGYLLGRALRNELPGRAAGSCHPDPCLPRRPAFDHPAKFVGPVYKEPQARVLAAERGYGTATHSPGAGSSLTRPVSAGAAADPDPVDAGALVVCAGGGGIPVIRDATACCTASKRWSTRT